MLSNVLWAANLSLWLLILLRGRRNNMWGEYPIVYGYAMFVWAITIPQALSAILFGLSSEAYYLWFHLPNLLVPLLQLWILGDLNRRIIGKTKFSGGYLLRSSMVVVVLTLPVAWGVFTLPDKPYISHDQLFVSYHLIMTMLQAALCAVIYQILTCPQERVHSLS